MHEQCREPRHKDIGPGVVWPVGMQKFFKPPLLFKMLASGDANVSKQSVDFLALFSLLPIVTALSGLFHVSKSGKVSPLCYLPCWSLIIKTICAYCRTRPPPPPPPQREYRIPHFNAFFLKKGYLLLLGQPEHNTAHTPKVGTADIDNNMPALESANTTPAPKVLLPNNQ